MCFAFGLLLDQRPCSGPCLASGWPHSCERGDAWREALGQELRAAMGATARRGSASVIDTLRTNQIAHIHALIQSHNARSVSPTPTASEDQSELSPSEVHSESEDGFPSQSALPLLRLSPVPLPSESRRHSDTCMVATSEPTNGNLSVPVPGGRRHSDLSTLLSLNSQRYQHHHAMPRSHMCQACLSLLLQRSQEGGHHHPSFALPTRPACACAFRHPHSSCGTGTTSSGPGGVKGPSDCSDFSLLQKSLFNIIGRKTAPSNPPSHQGPPLLRPPATNMPAHNYGDNVPLRTLPHSGSLGGEMTPMLAVPLQDRRASYSAGEQQATGALGVVGHTGRQVPLVLHLGPKPI